MEYQQKQSRTQLALYTTCLDDMIAEENSVRTIDRFVDGLDLHSLGFGSMASQGRPPYDPADLLKLYIYGYLNRIRSSRQLELECSRNIELMWLLGNLRPDHNTIARFRKDNPKAIKRVFRATVSIAKNHELIGAVLIAGDSTKLRAQNSKKNNFNLKKVARHLEYIDKKLGEHQRELAKADGDGKEEIRQLAKNRELQRERYVRIQKELRADTSTENPQISTSDPDSRHQIVRGTITEVCYTAQTTVDAEHKLLIDYKITNQNDKKAMGGMLRRAKAILGTNAFNALYDKGYHTGSEFKMASDLGIDTLVAVPGIGRASQAPDPAYNAEHFDYDPQRDSYRCPQGHGLTSNGNWYRARNYRFKQYRTKACRHCPVRSLCTSAKQNGKILQRSEFTGFIERNARRVTAQPDIYKKRQALVEHPFGTIKRQWGFDHIITKKGMPAASADFGLIALAYNLKRLMKLGWEAKRNMKQPICALKMLLINLKRLENAFLAQYVHICENPTFLRPNTP
ncbi:transposase IS4 family protein [Allomuricauda ruestringensis DSM 13258]|uniref:Transposase IS4 family protein n=1 Tax=Allomuricauda ruestringensis (strain DSM 13258 / CIP 107369 / LMG 19739 / B1) TaxID=886377 RepID=G2PQA5_ALLRU|nr:IS1182 family transposase [Allomuricauda ruestringensis]AEM71611.1 transposase IS4 family protein [Allomuricauda ruestringensis DSM 13258]